MIFLARAAVLISLSSLALTACEEGQGLNLGTKPAEGETAEPTAEQAPQTVLKDVERPDIFSLTEKALWDGRPSLGGVWAAHPDVKTPERAILTNVKTGKSTPGALFRRERANPGPRIQVSSDAAAALGMIAGQPVELKVLAVRQEEVVIEPVPAPEPQTAADPEKTPVSSEELAAAGIGDKAGEETPDSTEKPKKEGFFQRLFRKKPGSETAAAAAGTAAATIDDASAPAVETTALEPAPKKQIKAEAPKPRPDRKAAAAPAPKTGLKNPYIQVGQFGVEANADAAAANLRQQGIVPTVLPAGDSWRVLIGPVSTADDQAALLAQVKKLGFSDAFLAPR